MKALTNTLENLKGDKTIWFLVILLGFFSVLAVYSAVGSMAYKVRGGNTEYYLIQQTLFLTIGFVFMYLSYKFNYMFYGKMAPILILIAIPLLMYTIGFGTEINSATGYHSG